MGCGIAMIKYILFIFNFIFAVCGLAILALGVIVHLQIADVKNLDTNLTFPVITMIIVGSIIFVISFFGCCGAIRESHCMTITYASFVLFILLLQVAIGVYAFVVVKNNENQVDIVNTYRDLFNGYLQNNSNEDIVDVVQSSLNCCGVDRPEDYKDHVIPWSCCDKQKGETCSISEVHIKRGCGNRIKEELTVVANVLGGVVIGIAGVELIGIIFALCLANSIKNAERRGYRV